MTLFRGMSHMEERKLWELSEYTEVEEEIKNELEKGERLDKLLFIGQRNLHREIRKQEKRMGAIVTLGMALTSIISIAVSL